MVNVKKFELYGALAWMDPDTYYAMCLSGWMFYDGAYSLDDGDWYDILLNVHSGENGIRNYDYCKASGYAAEHAA